MGILVGASRLQFSDEADEDEDLAPIRRVHKPARCSLTLTKNGVRLVPERCAGGEAVDEGWLHLVRVSEDVQAGRNAMKEMCE